MMRSVLMAFSLFLSALGSHAVLANDTLTTHAPELSLITVSVRQAFEATEDANVAFIDVREADEVALGAPRGSRHFALSKLVPAEFERASGITKDRPLYIICRSGVRSLRAAKLLQSVGYQRLYNVDGGMMAWEAAGLP